jgi:hypothetical protein
MDSYSSRPFPLIEKKYTRLVRALPHGYSNGLKKKSLSYRWLTDGEERDGEEGDCDSFKHTGILGATPLFNLVEQSK